MQLHKGDQRESKGIDFNGSYNTIENWWAIELVQPSETQLFYSIN